MHPADKAVLRLAVGLGLAVLVAYGLALRLGFVACIAAVLILCKPGPPMPVLKGIVASVLVAALLVAGGIMVPLLQHYPFSGLMLTGALLYALFFASAGKDSPLTILLVMTCTLIPVSGFLQQGLSTVFGLALGAGLAIGALVSFMSHALFPDASPPAGKALPPAHASPEAARSIALQATLVIMPVYLLALINPSLCHRRINTPQNGRLNFPQFEAFSSARSD